MSMLGGSLNYWTWPDPWRRKVSRLLNKKTATSERWGWALRESPGELLAHRGHRNVAGFLGRPASDQARVGSLARNDTGP